jgi:hypothetical protein
VRWERCRGHRHEPDVCACAEPSEPESPGVPQVEPVDELPSLLDPLPSWLVVELVVLVVAEDPLCAVSAWASAANPATPTTDAADSTPVILPTRRKPCSLVVTLTPPSSSLA